MNITPDGDRLNILVTCDYSLHHDWMSFAAWYSIYKHMPDAKVAMLCARDLKDGYASYDWPYRCDIHFFQHENVGKHTKCMHLNKLYGTYVALKEEIVKQPLLVVDADVVALASLTPSVLERMNDPEVKFAVSGPVWYFNEQPLESFVIALHTYDNVKNKKCSDAQKIHSMLANTFGEPDAIDGLCGNCTGNAPTVFAHYSDTCGRFRKNEWVRNMMYPPFGFTAELGRGCNLTSNEVHTLKCWQQIRRVYEAVR